MASAYLSRTITNDSSNTKATISVWFKRTKSSSGTEHHLYAIQSGVDEVRLGFDGNDCMFFYYYPAGTGYNRTTNRKFRDFGAWYHVVVQFDSTQSTADDRIKIYINGIQETSFSLINNPSSSANSYLFQGTTGYIGCSENVAGFFDGVLSHYHLTHGYSYDASTFGEFDATSGIWKPKTSPSVTYGTNGFFLKFENSGAMGTDSSGNGNNFTVSGTITQTEDTPSNNFVTGNPIANGGGNLTFTNGNTTIYDTDSTWRSGFGGLAPSSGKWYFEVKRVGASSNVWIGIMDSSQLDGTGAYKFVAKSRGYGYSAGGEKGNNGTETGGWGDTYAQNDIVGVAMDLDNNKIYFSKNGTWQDSGDPTSGATGTGSMYDLASGYNYFPATSLYSTTAGVSFNFGNGYFGTTAVASSNSDGDGLGLFEYSVPSGYYALCTKNIKNYG